MGAGTKFRNGVGADANNYIDTNGLTVSAVNLATQASAVADYSITWTANEPTAGDAATIADGDLVAGTELGQAIADITAKVNAILAALRATGIIET